MVLTQIPILHSIIATGLMVILTAIRRIISIMLMIPVIRMIVRRICITMVIMMRSSLTLEMFSSSRTRARQLRPNSSIPSLSSSRSRTSRHCRRYY